MYSQIEQIWVIIGGFISMALLILTAFGYMNTRIGKVEKQSVEKDMCHQKYIELKERLDKGEARFTKLEQMLQNNLCILMKVSTTVDLIAKKNGIQ